MKYMVTFEVEDDDREGPGCIEGFWDHMADEAERIWKETMEGNIEVTDVK